VAGEVKEVGVHRTPVEVDRVGAPSWVLEVWEEVVPPLLVAAEVVEELLNVDEAAGLKLPGWGQEGLVDQRSRQIPTWGGGARKARNLNVMEEVDVDDWDGPCVDAVGQGIF